MKTYQEWSDENKINEELGGSAMGLNRQEAGAFIPGDRVRHLGSSTVRPLNGTVKGRVIHPEQGHVGFAVNWDSGKTGHHHPNELEIARK